MCGDCCCGSFAEHGGHLYGRRFLTKTEKIERLESYAEELKKEIVAVEARIQELKS
jgi:hypothetical protein